MVAVTVPYMLALGLLCGTAPSAYAAVARRPPPSFASRLIPYPGLNQAERDLVAKKPRAAIVVFIQKERAERASHRYFPNQVENDEGDAFRHFVWAGLLTKTLGAPLANRFLNAHEMRPGQPVEEERMDRFNNELGQRAALGLIERGEWSQRNLEILAMIALRTHQLIVIRPTVCF